MTAIGNEVQYHPLTPQTSPPDPTMLTTRLVETAVDHLRQLQEEKFTGISLQFTERDIRTQQAAVASGDALAAALQAAKELVGAQGEASAAAAVKSETSFTKQIDQIGTIIQTLEKALDARINELKERIDRGEGNERGSKDVRESKRSDTNLLVGLMSAGFVLLGIVVTVFALIVKGG